MNLIVAADEKWGIGVNGGLLTHIPDDLKYYKEKTTGSVIVLGRKTLESFPGGKPLPNRINIVMSRSDVKTEGITVVKSVGELLKELKKYPDKEVFVSGGAEIYKLLLPFCGKAYVTHIYKTFEADTFMPKIKDGWKKVSEEKHEYNGLSYGFAVYEREKEANRCLV